MIQVGVHVQTVRRTDQGVELRAMGDEWRAYDDVILATPRGRQFGIVAR